jgi:hypothetical protein
VFHRITRALIGSHTAWAGNSLRPRSGLALSDALEFAFPMHARPLRTGRFVLLFPHHAKSRYACYQE